MEAKVSGIELTLADGSTHVQTGTAGPVERAVNSSTGTLGIAYFQPRQRPAAGPIRRRGRCSHQGRGAAGAAAGRAGLQNQRRRGRRDNKIAFRNVKVGPRVDALWVIEDGLARRTGRGEGLQYP